MNVIGHQAPGKNLQIMPLGFLLDVLKILISIVVVFEDSEKTHSSLRDMVRMIDGDYLAILDIADV